MVELIAEGQQLEEELRQILDYTQGSSLARFRMNKKRHTGCDVDVCMMILHVQPEIHERNTSQTFSVFVAFPLVSFPFCLFLPFAP